MLSRLASKSGFYRHLIRNMIVTIIGVSFVPIFLVSLTAYYQFNKSYREKVHAHLSSLVLSHQRQIDAFLRDRLADIVFLADNFGHDQLSRETVLDSKLLSLRQSNGAVFVDLGLVNAQGIQEAYAGPFKLSRVSYADAQWFQEAMRGEAVISDVFLGIRGFPHFIVAVRRMVNGQPWVLRSTIDFVAFNNLVENVHIGESGFAFILNKKGELQTKPRYNLNLTDSCYGGLYACDRNSAPEVRIEERRDPAGIMSIYVTSLLKDQDWLLVYKQYRDDAFADQRRAETISMIIFILGGIGIVLMSLLLSVRMVNHIARADRETEIMNKQVIESGKLASLGELATGVAHEINNPVAIMVEEAGWIEDVLSDMKLKEDDNLQEIHRSVKQIVVQGRRCKEITTKLLSFARGSGSAEGNLQLNTIIREVVELASQRMKYANIQSRCDLQPDLPEIRASETEMHQVLLNLTNNAIAAMEKSGGILQYKTSQDGDNILMEVADNGPGIPAGIIDRIFDPFFTTKPVGQGTGLGLSICYGIIRKLNGEIQVSSAAGQGARFQIRLPRLPSARVKAAAEPMNQLDAAAKQK